MRHKLSYQRLRLRFLFLRQLSICSSKVVDYFVEILAGLRVWSNLNKLSIAIGNVRVQSEGHRDVEEVLESFEARSEKSCLAFHIEINIELVHLSFSWEISQLDIVMMEQNSREILCILV